MKKTYYVIRHDCDFPPCYWSPSSGSFKQREESEHFETVPQALKALQTSKLPMSGDRLVLIRVEETPGVETREFVQGSDLHLLDDKYVARVPGRGFVSGGSVDRELEYAELFPTAGLATYGLLRSAVQARCAWIGAEVVRVRVVPGKPTITETVVA